MRRTQLHKKQYSIKRTPLHATAKALRAKTYKPLKRTVIKKVTAKQSHKEKYWHILVNFLIKYRAKGVCEIHGEDCKIKANSGHHIRPRNMGRVDTAGNCICSCSGENCHNHSLHGVGMPISKEEAFKRVTEANKACGISDTLTGEEIESFNSL
jgi:hypothetical protein